MDRLDRPLTIAHIQGGFELQVVYNTGHFVHEDATDEFTAVVLSFLRRHSIIPDAQYADVMETALATTRPR
jgi:protein phosphatase methylesterase 1